MSLAGIAKETVAIVERGQYTAPSGATVEIRAGVDAAVRGTRLYVPDALDALMARAPGASSSSRPRVEVTPESTGDAGRRLIEREGCAHVVALNFASAKNPGGGFLGGAKAQEETLARCSALYHSLLEARGYYDANRAHGTAIYTDHAIYSPDVPFFRDDAYALLERPFALSVITAPAPNAGVVLERDPGALPAVREALVARAGRVLAIAHEHGHRTLVLGAWGCGVFRNDPRQVAEAFASWLVAPRFAGAFDRVVFAVYAPRRVDGDNLHAFEQRFAGGLS